MTLIKNFERFVNENLSQKFQIFEDVQISPENGYPDNDVAAAEFESWLATPSAAQFRTFAALQQGGGNKLKHLLYLRYLREAKPLKKVS
jgi:hypothetical protein